MRDLASDNGKLRERERERERERDHALSRGVIKIKSRDRFANQMRDRGRNC